MDLRSIQKEKLNTEDGFHDDLIILPKSIERSPNGFSGWNWIRSNPSPTRILEKVVTGIDRWIHGRHHQRRSAHTSCARAQPTPIIYTPFQIESP